MKKSLTPVSSDILNALSSLDPLEVLKNWLNTAKKKSQLKEPWAMGLATSLQGTPSVRVVLLKKLEGGSLIFFSNYLSKKGKEIAKNPKAAALFHWDKLGRQVCIQGTIKKVNRKQSLEYWNQRDRNSQLSQWVSKQSEPVADRKTLETLRTQAEKRFQKTTIPCPKHWGGYLLSVETIEFWQNRSHRFHDRFLFKKSGSFWIGQRLFP